MHSELDLPKDFDFQFYRLSYPEAKRFSRSDCIVDFECHQLRGSQRYKSALQYLVDAGIPKCLVDLFSWKDYIDRNPDLEGMTPLEACQHYVQNGIKEPRYTRNGPNIILRKYALDFTGVESKVSSVKVQAIVHCYYFDILLALEFYLRTLVRLGGDVHIYVNNETIPDVLLDSFVSELNSGASMVRWKRTPNLYDDWPSFHEAYKDGLFSSPGITYKLQTKKSSYLGADGGRTWLDELAQPILGSYGCIDNVVSSVGVGANIVGSLLHQRIGFGINPTPLVELNEYLGIDNALAIKFPFVAGAVFAISNECAQSFYAALPPIDYSKTYEKGTKYCGRYIGHALERAICYWAVKDSMDGIQWVC